MTRLISNSTRSSWAASTDGGTGEPGLAGELSIGVLAALVTGLPGRAGPRIPQGHLVDRAAGPPRSPVSYTELCERSCDEASWPHTRARRKRASTTPARRARRLL